MNNQLLLGDFVAEIDEVQSTLLAATTDLTSPLGDLVRAQIKRSQPPICGAVVLAVAVSTPTTKPTTMYSESLQAEEELRRKRILLAAALEMLHVALNVHRLLVNAALREQQSNGKNALDPSFIGSTILAGDYCFSRAAQMAAQTDHPRVVALFSLALQTVSEGLLREQFRRVSEPTSAQNDAQDSSQFHAHDGNHSDLANLVTNEASVEDEYGGENNNENGNKYGNGNYDETRQLLHSGAHAAALLIDLAESEQQQAIALSHELASHWALHKQRTGADEHQSLSHSLNNWGEALPGRWQALHHWLDYQHTNSKASPISPKLPPKTSPEASSKRCD